MTTAETRSIRVSALDLAKSYLVEFGVSCPSCLLKTAKEFEAYLLDGTVPPHTHEPALKLVPKDHQH